jgi:hypothetical protein
MDGSGKLLSVSLSRSWTEYDAWLATCDLVDDDVTYNAISIIQ